MGADPWPCSFINIISWFLFSVEVQWFFYGKNTSAWNQEPREQQTLRWQHWLFQIQTTFSLWLQIKLQVVAQVISLYVWMSLPSLASSWPCHFHEELLRQDCLLQHILGLLSLLPLQCVTCSPLLPFFPSSFWESFSSGDEVLDLISQIHFLTDTNVMTVIHFCWVL